MPRSTHAIISAIALVLSLPCAAPAQLRPALGNSADSLASRRLRQATEEEFIRLGFFAGVVGQQVSIGADTEGAARETGTGYGAHLGYTFGWMSVHAQYDKATVSAPGSSEEHAYDAIGLIGRIGFADDAARIAPGLQLDVTSTSWERGGNTNQTIGIGFGGFLSVAVLPRLVLGLEYRTASGNAPADEPVGTGTVSTKERRFATGLAWYF